MDLNRAIRLIDTIADLQRELPALEPLAERLVQSADPKAAPAVIRCLERTGSQDDGGLFKTLGHYLEEIDPDDVVDGSHLKAELLASLRRAPMRKTVELFHYVWFDEAEQRQVLPLLLDTPELDADSVALYAQLADDLGYRIVQRAGGWSLATERVD